MSDLISREEMERISYDYWEDKICRDAIHEFMDVIDEVPSAQPELSTDIQEIINYLDITLHPIVSPDNWHVYSELHDMVSRMPSAQPEWDDASAWKPYHESDDIPNGRYLVQTSDGEMHTGWKSGFGWIFGHYVPPVVAYRKLPEKYKGGE